MPCGEEEIIVSLPAHAKCNGRCALKGEKPRRPLVPKSYRGKAFGTGKGAYNGLQGNRGMQLNCLVNYFGGKEAHKYSSQGS